MNPADAKGQDPKDQDAKGQNTQGQDTQGQDTQGQSAAGQSAPDHDLLRQANRLYDLEQDRLQRLLVQDPLFADLLGRVARVEAAGLSRLDPLQAQALSEARRLLFALTFEAAFKMGFLQAHAHADSSDEAAGLEG